MPKIRQSQLSVRTLAVGYSSGSVLQPHTHQWHQLVYASAGVMNVETAEGAWVVPPQRAVWLPAGTSHSIGMFGAVSMRTLYLRPRLSRALPRRCQVVNVSPLLRELVLHTVEMGMLDSRKAVHKRLIGVLVDQLQVMAAAPMQLPMPRDLRALDFAQKLRAAPGAASLDVRVRGAGASKRTLERLFLLETGLSLGRWQQQARLLHALRLLAAGGAVTSVALEVGYESPSAFISLFKRTFGVTPGRYF